MVALCSLRQKIYDTGGIRPRCSRASLACAGFLKPWGAHCCWGGWFLCPPSPARLFRQPKSPFAPKIRVLPRKPSVPPMAPVLGSRRHRHVLPSHFGKWPNCVCLGEPLVGPLVGAVGPLWGGGRGGGGRRPKFPHQVRLTPFAHATT